MNLQDLRKIPQKPRYVPKRIYSGFRYAYEQYVYTNGEYPICPVCGEPIEDGNFQIGHIKARFANGPDDIENYVLVHPNAPCNVGVADIDMNAHDINKTIRLLR